MKHISVTTAGLREDFNNWGVPADYTDAFLNKCGCSDERVTLRPFAFNDTEHLTDQRHWLAANAAFWCRAYREAETACEQAETLASVRAVFYIAGTLGQGEVTALIRQWWSITSEIHQLPAPNYSLTDYQSKPCAVIH